MVRGGKILLDDVRGYEMVGDLEGISLLLAAVGTMQVRIVSEQVSPSATPKTMTPVPAARDCGAVAGKARLLNEVLDQAGRQLALNSRTADRAVRAAAGRGADAQESLTGTLAEVTHGIMTLATIVEQATELARCLARQTATEQ